MAAFLCVPKRTMAIGAMPIFRYVEGAGDQPLRKVILASVTPKIQFQRPCTRTTYRLHHHDYDSLKTNMDAHEELVYRPISVDSWKDLEALFGERGGREGCWCMRWRIPRLQFEQQKGASNRRALRAGVEAGRIRNFPNRTKDPR